MVKEISNEEYEVLRLMTEVQNGAAYGEGVRKFPTTKNKHSKCWVNCRKDGQHTFSVLRVNAIEVL